jgi:hypothetical protein
MAILAWKVDSFDLVEWNVDADGYLVLSLSRQFENAVSFLKIYSACWYRYERNWFLYETRRRANNVPLRM